MTALVYYYLVLQVLDVITTSKGLEIGLKEGNPYVQKMMDYFGEFWAGIKLIVAIAALCIIFVSHAFWALPILCFFYTVLVYRNYKLIKEHTK